MPFLAALMGGLSTLFASRLGQWIGTALLFLGIGFATQQLAVQPILDYLAAGFSGLPATVVQWVAFLNIDKYCSIVASAYLAAAGKRVILRKLAS